MRRLICGVLLVAACSPTIATKTDAPVPTPLSSVTAAMPSPTAAPTAAVTAAPAPIPTPAAASTATLAPRDAQLAARLADWCALLRPGAPPRPPLPLDVIVGLADGHSGRDVVALLARANCGLLAVTWGQGVTEAVAIGDEVGPGALLWVDRGWWRVARLPFGYRYSVPSVDREIAGAREIHLPINSGGTAGDVGLLVVRVSGAAASIALDVRPGSHLSAWLTDDDHLLVSARKLPDRPWGWSQNCCLPGGHDWLYERRGAGFALVAERQTIGPGFALNAFVGAIATGRPDFATDVGTPKAITSAALLITQSQYWSADAGLLGAWDRDETRRWEALPRPLVLDRPDITATVGHSGVTGVLDRKYVATLGYVDGGWRVTSFVLPRIGGPG